MGFLRYSEVSDFRMCVIVIQGFYMAVFTEKSKPDIYRKWKLVLPRKIKIQTLALLSYNFLKKVYAIIANR